MRCICSGACRLHRENRSRHGCHHRDQRSALSVAAVYDRRSAKQALAAASASTTALLAHHRDNNFPPVRGAPMFEKKDTLPCAELHSSIHNWNGLACPSKHHPDVRWHVVG